MKHSYATNLIVRMIVDDVDKCGGWKQLTFEYHTPKNTPI